MRFGKTRKVRLSLDVETFRSLRALAMRRHDGKVAALLAEFVQREATFAAERFFEKYRIPVPDEGAMARIEAEWNGESARPPPRLR